MSFGVHMYTVLLGIDLEVEFLGHRCSVCSVLRVPGAAHPCQHLVLSKPFWCVYIIISLYNLLIALLCVSLMANDFRNPFNTFSGHLDILFCKGLVKTH